ncbi:hypothetical protein BKH43_04775 [Helicobacter sp. 13S00401-1]|uniref:hypothetical protein n=1 Tax=Helicobacter sp. 13S00401-1 TaxID=1905758 RepID=UPI000BA79FB9|nr:hypothetical protein [Helicobacter sp. 13S00401-1]PAF50409.1 hypothetical protein BKH43_04775 [Helicobacter sp. 13S00401-1]
MELNSKALKELGTRLVETRLKLELSLSEDSKNAFEAEFLDISFSQVSPVDRWINNIYSRSEARDSDPLVLELLCELYKKLDGLEMMLSKESKSFLELKYEAYSTFLGHGVIVLEDSKNLEPFKEYYARLSLPVFPTREVPLFATLEPEGILKITKMGKKDIEDFDNYIALVERESIRNLKLS